MRWRDAIDGVLLGAFDCLLLNDLMPRLPGPAHIQRELARVTAALRTYQHASQGAQNAIETALRGMGRVTVNSALLLLPPKVAIPGVAVRAIAHVVDRGVDLGLGR